jgi:dipeptide transport system ATP-binding protein
MTALVDIDGLAVDFETRRGVARAVDGLTLEVREGEALGIVGESGSGKSVAMLALMGLVAANGRVEAHRLAFAGRDLLTASRRARRRLAGKDMAMIFQEPTTSLNPCFTVGYQIAETLKAHQGGSSRQRRDRAVELMAQVGIPDPGRRLGAYPHQMSGGMNQRVMIAIAIACNPRLLIADEPTTALDVTIQAQILDLLRRLREEQGTALVLITHDMAVVAETTERVVVMYAGQAVEQGPTAQVLAGPRHPYTAALLDALPERAPAGRPLATIPGIVPGLGDRPAGCVFNPRCRFVEARCRAEAPGFEPADPRAARCHFPLDGAAA